MSDGLFDDVPLMNKERDNSWEAFIKRKDVKAMFSEEGFGFPLNRGYYDLWCIAWAKAWDKGFMSGRKREWVGLTDDETDEGLLRSDYALQTAHAWRAGVVFAMTKLKEKNI